LFSTGQFDSVRVEQRDAPGKVVLAIVVTERPLQVEWNITGAERISPRVVRDRVQLEAGRPLDRAPLTASAFAIDSMYGHEGYYGARVTTRTEPVDSGTVRVSFNIDEGNRVAISQVVVEGNERFSDQEVVGAIASKPEGFWWFRPGKYDEEQVDMDVRE